MVSEYSLFEAFLPYTDFLFSVKDILEKTSKNSDFDLFVLEKIKEANLKHSNHRKLIKKFLDKNASEFRKKIGFNIKTLTNYYDPIFQYMSKAGETSLEFCLGVANEFHNNYFSKESDAVKQLIIRGEIDFNEIIETINVFREINQISTSSESSRIGKRLVYEDDDFIVYYPRTHKYFVDVIHDLNFYKEIDWCTKELAYWLKYNKEYATCILISKKANEKNFKNMQLVSYKIRRKDSDDNSNLYVTDYDETCNFFNHHMNVKEFEDFYPGFVSNIAPRIEENVKLSDTKESFDKKELEKQLQFCFKKRNSEVLEVVLNKYLDISIEKYYKINEDPENIDEEEYSIGKDFVEHITNIINLQPERFENTKEDFFEAISNILVFNSEPGKNPSYVRIIKGFTEDLNTIVYNNMTLTNHIHKHIITKSMSSSMHVNYYYYILFSIIDNDIDQDESIFDSNKAEIGEKCVLKILNSKSEVACNTVLTVNPMSGLSIQEILSTEIFETIFNTKYFEKLMLGKIENIQARVMQGIANLIQDADTFGRSNFANKLYNSRPEFNRTLKSIADLYNITLVNSSELLNSETVDRESILKIILYNDLTIDMLNNLYEKKYFNAELIKTITELDFIENNGTKVKLILSTIDRFKANTDLDLLNAINDASISYILDMNLSSGKTLSYIFINKEHVILTLLSNPETDLYDKEYVRIYFSNNRNKILEKFDSLKAGFLKYINDLMKTGDTWQLRNRIKFFDILNDVMKENKPFAKKVFNYLLENIEDTKKHKQFLLEYFLIKYKIFDSFDDSMSLFIDETIASLLINEYSHYTSGEKIYSDIINKLDIKYVIDTIFEAPISEDVRKSFMTALLEKVSEFYGEKRTIDLIKTKIENAISRRYYSTYNITSFIEIYRQFVKEKKISLHLNHALYPTIQKFIEFMNVDRVNKIPEDDLKVQNRFESVIRQYVRALLS